MTSSKTSLNEGFPAKSFLYRVMSCRWTPVEAGWFLLLSPDQYPISSGMQFASPESGCVPGRSAELPYPQGANLRKVREIDEAVERASAGREYGHRDRA